MQGLKHKQKVKSPQEEKETKFPLAFHAEGKNEPSMLRVQDTTSKDSIDWKVRAAEYDELWDFLGEFQVADRVKQKEMLKVTKYNKSSSDESDKSNSRRKISENSENRPKWMNSSQKCSFQVHFKGLIPL